MPRTLRLRLLVPVAALALVATACSSGDDADPASSAGSPPPPASAPAEVDQGTPNPAEPSPAPSPEEGSTEQAATVTVEGFDYEMPASVAAGSEVTVVNNDREAHTFTLGGSADVQLVVQGGASESFTAPEAGTYEVTCDFHGGMTAELVVT